MSEKESGYTHTSGTPGQRSGSDTSAETEHRDTAHGNAGDRNEIDAGRRAGEGDGYGPRTHEDTRTVKKGE